MLVYRAGALIGRMCAVRTNQSIAIGVFLLAFCSVPESLAEIPQAVHDMARLVYDKTADVPDEVFLSHHLNSLNIRFRGDPSRLADHVKHEMDLATNREAKQFAQYLFSQQESIQADFDQYKRDTVCPFDVSRPEGAGVFEALNALDDNSDVINRRHLENMASELGAEKYFKFRAWMDRAKSSFTIIRFDQAKNHQGKEPNLLRQDICGRFDSVQPQ